MQKPDPQRLPIIGDIESRTGLRDSFKRIYEFLQNFLRADQTYKVQVVSEISTLYGEGIFNFSLGNGGATLAAINVPGAQVGYVVEGAAELPIGGTLVTYHVQAENLVWAVFHNMSGSTLNFNGKIRVYVKPRMFA